MNSSTTSSYAQFIIVLLIFVGVLAVTFFVTKWMAGYQKSRRTGTNIELIESAPLTANKHIQIVRLGSKYVALAVSKDNVSLLTELTKDDIILNEGGSGQMKTFRDIMSKIRFDSDVEDSDSKTEEFDGNE